MNTHERLALIRQVGEEIITEEDLRQLLDREERFVAYDGFEPSGQIHIAQGVLRAINVNKMIRAGAQFKMLVADWHALANNKMGGDLEKIQTVGRYFIEVWRAAGMDLKNVEFVWASELVKDSNYWMLVLKIAKTNSIRRFVRTAEIMGREESMDLTAAQILYPCMQTADIFTLGARVTQLGMDQRKVNMLAREVGDQLGFWKPVVVSHHMLMGLQQQGKEQSAGGAQPQREADDERETAAKRVIQLKMSKSKPDGAIFMTDTKEDIQRKIGKAWCPEGEVKENPILEYCRYIIFERFPEIRIDRAAKFGGAVTMHSYAELEKEFAEKEIHPQDLKEAVIPLLDELIEPVRRHFEKDATAHRLLETVRGYQITR